MTQVESMPMWLGTMSAASRRPRAAARSRRSRQPVSPPSSSAIRYSATEYADASASTLPRRCLISREAGLRSQMPMSHRPVKPRDRSSSSSSSGTWSRRPMPRPYWRESWASQTYVDFATRTSSAIQSRSSLKASGSSAEPAKPARAPGRASPPSGGPRRWRRKASRSASSRSRSWRSMATRSAGSSQPAHASRTQRSCAASECGATRAGSRRRWSSGRAGAVRSRSGSSGGTSAPFSARTSIG